METQFTVMNTETIANRLVVLCRQGKNIDAINELYSERVISVEPNGLHPYKIEGKLSVIAKNKQWLSTIKQFNKIKISEPVISGNYFSCAMEFEVLLSEVGQNAFKEICVYEVEKGKIIFEQFFFQIQ